MLEMLSSSLLGDRALQIAYRAYIRSAVLLIYGFRDEHSVVYVDFGNTNLIILVAPCVVLSHPENEVEDRNERPDSVRVSSKHDVAEANVVVGRDMAGGDSCERRLKTTKRMRFCQTHNVREIAYLLVELDTLHDLQCQREVTQQAMYTEQADDAEVAKHAIERPSAVLANNVTRTVSMICFK